ncbi:MAG: hypothetical protein EWV58_19820 [Microcystis aeruginosa Ma_MB_F_20061100_S19]|uniref:Uncharacterized protein n=1 Tax=Microcystis aeruginosa SPC777 TaxID=482300 RepID=S3JBV5_MICAE|nr:hypothetical protein [Microcystis aeruginosa]EPF22036.1 hypothetical protein MAESPC_02122 [Microcystis aeruginosa SPC777]NCR98386.1 hypothetical protein [Microcystis aeruginosa L311-01]TRU09841.1 MAG: hypothetical protein EWV59_13490 [Microcystis aeruginosa Ma_MB_F_20061100_S19D]TRU10770.1 MAG: hypothetical protein EWV58_19820 [Microcystis aeruginosa Ma_MB_F_20061100_S19]
MPISLLCDEPSPTPKTPRRSARDDPPYRITPTAPNKHIWTGLSVICSSIRKNILVKWGVKKLEPF